MFLYITGSAQSVNITNGDGSALTLRQCYENINYEIKGVPAGGVFNGCGVFDSLGRTYWNPIRASAGTYVFPYACNLTYEAAGSLGSKSMLVWKPVVVAPALTDLNTCDGHFTLLATPMYAGDYIYWWEPSDGTNGYVYRPDTALTDGYTNKTQQFRVSITDIQSGCVGKDSLVVHIDQITKPEIQSVSLDGYTLATKATYSSYQWLHEGKHLLGATDPFLVVRRNGNYQVIASNGLWCSDTSDNYNINTVSIEEYRNVVRDSDIYPNPATDMLHVNIDKVAEIYIFSIEGKLMKQYKYNNNTIYIGELPKGIYLIHLKDIKGEVLKMDRFVKL